ncbi:MAG: hypothetical protein C0609_06155 [Deltaproteobacteria bacterium]|nr:MAG: hypothetical protein C0609_06155 [Deltaproteobacteria bacterium]
MKPLKITDNIWWVGILDPQLRVFDVVMKAEHGTTYNSYLIKGTEKTALIEANKGRFSGEFISRLSEVVDPKEIDYIILNHMEPDHSGALADLMEVAPQAQLFFTRAGKSFAENVSNKLLDDAHVIADGETLDLGGRTLEFMVEPYLHWPDTMFTYLKEDKILFTCDFLGAHYCDDRLFDDLVGNYDYAFKYYFTAIMRPFKSHVRRALERISGLDVKMVLTSHGPIIRTKLAERLESYREWSLPLEKGDKKTLAVLYVSAYGNTERMGLEIAEGAKSAGVETEIYDLGAVDMERLLNEVEKADGIAIGSCTINGDALPQTWEFLAHLIHIDTKGMVGGAFGSFAWSGEASLLLTERLKGLKFKVPEKPVRARLTPTPEDLANCRAFGETLAKAL